MPNQSLERLSLEILTARRNRDKATSKEAFRVANIKVAAAFEAWRTIAFKGTK